MGKVLTPSAAMFGALKSLGLSYRDATRMLLDEHARIGGHSVDELVANAPLLSRRVVHAQPGSLPIECFADFTASARGAASSACCQTATVTGS